MWQEILASVEEAMKIFRENINDGLAETQVLKFVMDVEQELGCSFPKEYLEILKYVNGLEFNGSILYGADLEFIQSTPNQRINGLIDNNKVLYENEWQKQYLFLGEDSISWYVYDLQSKQYLKLDNPSGDEVHRFSTCEEMVENLLSVSLM